MLEIMLADIRYREMQAMAQDHLVREAAPDSPWCISPCSSRASNWE
ncbi:MAG: hypothetical protein KY456_12355 [Chloroflexi bacterium]|nr:hypothetical protein [Chloroflexota bacterium]